jgi:hypothetical protein
MSDDLSEELEVLAAVYGEEFKYIPETGECQFDLQDPGSLRFILRIDGLSYPDKPPILESVSCFRAGKEIVLPWDINDPHFTGRTSTISDLAQALREKSENIEEELPTAGEEGEDLEDINPLQNPDYVATATDELLPTLKEALLGQGFESYDNGIYFHVQTGVMVTLPEMTGEVTIECPSRDKVELNYWMSITWPQLCEGLLSPPRYAELLIKLYKEQSPVQESKDTLVEEEVNDSDYSRYLPTPEDFGLEPQGSPRNLLIYTWGRQLRKQSPVDSQKDFNAAVLNGRGGGANLRKENGLCKSVQNNVARCALFPTWLEMVVSAVEKNDLQAISVICAKGRHRSVAAAELLKQKYYPQAKLVHLTIV